MLRLDYKPAAMASHAGGDDPWVVTPELQAQFYRTGHIIVRRAFDAAQVGRMSEAFDRAVDQALAKKGTTLAELERGGTSIRDGVDLAEGHGRWTHGGLPQRDPRYVLDHSLTEDSEELGRVATDERVLSMVGGLLGAPVRLGGSDGHVFYGDTGWHPDSGWAPRLRQFAPENVSLRIAIYLDPVGSDSGCLRAIPGSHCSPLHDRLAEAWTSQRSPSDLGPSDATGVPNPTFERSDSFLREELPQQQVLETEPGDIVLFESNIWHGAFTKDKSLPRRMIGLDYSVVDSEWVNDWVQRREAALSGVPAAVALPPPPARADSGRPKL